MISSDMGTDHVPIDGNDGSDGDAMTTNRIEYATSDYESPSAESLAEVGLP